MNAEPNNSKTLRLNDSLKDEFKKDETYMILGKTFQPLPKKNNTSFIVVQFMEKQFSCF